MSRFHLELDENERFNLVVSLSNRIVSMGSMPMRDADGYVSLISLLNRLVNLHPLDLPPSQSVMGASPATKPAPAPPQVPTPPAPADNSPAELVITPVKVDQPPDGKSMVVHYRIRTGNAVRLTKMHCWDPAQFGSILETVGKSTTFLLKTTSKGFVNIVGVKR
jgi:hypothetical protein